LQLAPGMQVLLCSEGLDGVVADSVLAETLGSEASIEDKCKRLIAAAREAGGPDNVTAVLLRAAD